ncbi:MAG: DsbA family protein [Deinococcales bacterium]
MQNKSQRLVITTAIILVAIILGLIVYSQVATGSKGPSAKGELDYSNHPVWGNPEAAVKVAMFEDFLCPHCAEYTDAVLPRLKQDYADNDKVAFYFYNYPLTANFGPNSLTTAISSKCVYQQSNDGFWDYKAALMRAQKQITYTTSELVKIATDIVPDIDAGALRSCIEEKKTEGLVEEDLLNGVAVGVTGTPSIFINGVKTQSYAYETVKAAIEAALAE